jgi:hypothetical protein
VDIIIEFALVKSSEIVRCYMNTIISRSLVLARFLYLCKMSDLFRLVPRSLEIGFIVTVVVVPDLVIPRKGYSGGDIGRPRDEGRWGEEGWNKRGNRGEGEGGKGDERDG